MPATKDTRKPDHVSRILDAAAELFLELGFEQTSTADIARRAKVSKRELYGHFDDKRAILTEVITRLQKNIWSEMDIEWASEEDLRSVLLHSGSAILRFIISKKFRNLFRIVAAESFHNPVAAKEFYLLGPGAGRQQTAKFLERHMKNGNLRRANPLQAADDYLNLVISARFMTAVALGQTERAMAAKGHVEHAVDVFLAFYEPPGAKPRKQPPARQSRRSATSRNQPSSA